MNEDQDIEQVKANGNEQGDIPEEVGSVKIADEVISIVAGLAATH